MECPVTYIKGGKIIGMIEKPEVKPEVKPEEKPERKAKK